MLPTPAEVGSALAHLENYRVLHVQELMYPYKPISASVMLALGFRESHLKNVCGGATWNGKEWVQSYSDRGYLQISDEYDTGFLKESEGCPNGWWHPDPTKPAVNALTPMHVPRFTQATLYVQREMKHAYDFAGEHRVSDKVRFAIAAHNAGLSGALSGYRAGDVDKNTAGGDYSKYVLAVAPMIHNWIVGHPNWVYKPNVLDQKD